jgi:hypothetical protein
MRILAALFLMISAARAENPYIGVWQCKFPGGEELLRVWGNGITSVQWVKADRFLSGNANQRADGLWISWSENSKELGHLSDATSMLIERGNLRETCKREERPSFTGFWSCHENGVNGHRTVLIAEAADGGLRKSEGAADASIRWDEARGRATADTAQMAEGAARWDLRLEEKGRTSHLVINITTTNSAETHSLDCKLDKRPHSFPQIPRAH